jgi:O-acetyl-ADP-ribose deacetylase (regulator of RNase III)/ADP-ribose pyrophosphatase YjhB (NUDIX family)
VNIRGCEITIIKADITALKADAIVNAANNELVMGGGVAGAIKRRGGQAIEDEAVKKGPIAVGEAMATSAGKLPAKFVIHAATMGMDFKTDEIKVRNSCRNALKVAEELEISSVALPALGCGVGGFPHLAAAKIMAQEVYRHLRETRSNLKEIIFCLYDQEAFEVFNNGVVSYLEHIIDKLQRGPFTTVDAIIEINEGIVIVQRSNPPFGWALPGGFVDYGESLEEAVRREMKEETDLELTDLKQFHTYSEPGRDPRFHTIATVFTAKGKGAPKAGDDAAGLKVVKASEIEKIDFAFDHKQIIDDYLKSRRRD